MTYGPTPSTFRRQAILSVHLQASGHSAHTNIASDRRHQRQALWAGAVGDTKRADI